MSSPTGNPCEQLANDLPTYEYPPLSLEQFRILKLHRGDFNSPLKVTLGQHNIGSTELGYDSLSYFWGDPKRSIPIICNGSGLKITASLEIALRRLRSQTEERMLWTDAICINQNDEKERAQQVLLMGKIYSRASKVVIWLGEADKDTDLALSVIEEWSSFNHQNRDDFDDTRYRKFEQQFTLRPEYEDSLKAVGFLTYRPWFDRCWTFQEILLATKAEIKIGEFNLSWDSLHYALIAFPVHMLAKKVLNFNALFMCYGKAKVKKMASLGDTVSISPTLSKLLEMTRSFVASNPRDKIFSMLGLATLRNRQMFRPLYDMSVHDTFILFTLTMIRDENNLNVLTYTGEPDRDRNLPSWCPDWNRTRGVGLIGYYNFVSYSINHNFNPGFQTINMSTSRELELEGAFIDVVKEAHDLTELLKDLKVLLYDSDPPPILSKFARHFGLENRMLLDKLSPEAVLLRTLSTDRWFFGAKVQDFYKEQWFPTHMRSWGAKQQRSPDCMAQLTMTRARRLNMAVPVCSEVQKIYEEVLSINTINSDSGEIKNFGSGSWDAISKEAIAQVRVLAKGNRLLITEHGFVALCSAKAKVGDSLCTLWGADVPFVMRQKNDLDEESTTTDAHRIISECYIDGVMYGELFREVKDENDKVSSLEPLMDWVQPQNFKIC